MGHWEKEEYTKLQDAAQSDLESAFDDKYKIISLIGRGSSAVVWKAYDRHLNRQVAIKHFAPGSQEAQWEAKMLKELKYPAFVTALDYTEQKQGSYLVMEYISGQSLAEYIRLHGRVEQELAVRWGLELAEALQYLHERKCPVIYRDLKPANIILEDAGSIRLIDFGAACYLYEDGRREVRAAGTRGYAAPEQLKPEGLRQTDERSDIYSFGAALFHMLTGCNPSKPPFLMQPLRYYDRRLSDGLEKVIVKATQKEKEKRYVTVRALKRELERYKEKDRVRRRAERIGAAAYYGLLAIGACRFFECWKKAEQYMAGGTRRYLELPVVNTAVNFCAALTMDCAAQQQITERRMLWTALLLIVLCMTKEVWERWSRRGIRSMKQERNVVLTQKKRQGAFWLILVVFLSVGIAADKSAYAKAAGQEENTLFVTVMNEEGQKLLIRYDAEYALSAPLCLQLAPDNFEEGEHYELRLDCTNRRTGDSCSRIFYLKRVEP